METLKDHESFIKIQADDWHAHFKQATADNYAQLKGQFWSIVRFRHKLEHDWRKQEERYHMTMSHFYGPHEPLVITGRAHVCFLTNIFSMTYVISGHKEDYANLVEAADEFLSKGRSRKIQQTLSLQMENASEEE